jgi:hypothetical protein
MSDLVIGKDGEPIIALDVLLPVRSGNPYRQQAGRFGKGPDQVERRKARQDRRSGSPAGQGRRSTDGRRPDVLRRQDAVTDAARGIKDIDDDRALRDFVRRRWSGTRALTNADIQAFIEDVRAQRLQDVVDALDDRVRSGVLKKNDAVRVSFPRGWLKRTMRGLSDDEIGSVLDRLRARGWTEQQVRQHVVSRFDDDRRRLAQIRSRVEE